MRTMLTPRWGEVMHVNLSKLQCCVFSSLLQCCRFQMENDTFAECKYIV